MVSTENKTIIKPLHYRFIKRLMDIILSGLALIVLSPMFLVVFLIIRKDGGKAIYTQERVGIHEKPFTIYKYRSMVPGAATLLERDKVLWAKYIANGNKFPPGEDPRITPIGHFIRHYSIDELPQLVNIFKGDMSIVGPRPIQAFEIACYGEKYDIVSSMKPGLTGWWQVNGRSQIHFPERANMDCDYIRFSNIWWDLKIIFMTFGKVVIPDGAW
jgi:lipopolysaccharide/colanic/teichoic acid biosynthesis glycosyltransferase